MRNPPGDPHGATPTGKPIDFFATDISRIILRGCSSSESFQIMAEFQELLDFPLAPKLGIEGKLDPRKATESEKRGQAIFFGKA